MGKLAQSASKYIIHINFQADGTVEKPDVIGAVFGQTEGLLGQDMDLRELQKTGRIGRIDVLLKTEGGKTSGMIIIPSSLDSSETALIAATMETIERIGPCNTKLKVEDIEDARITKRKYVVDRAQALLGTMFEQGMPETQELSEQIKTAVRVGEVTEYMGLPAGPDLDTYDAIVIVEGRADVIKLLRNGIKNVIAIEGTSIPPAIATISKTKETTLFLDGDRGGDLILKEAMSTCEIDFVSRAPEGKEVEDLTKKEIFKALREREPLNKAKMISGGDKRPERRYESKSYEGETKSYDREERSVPRAPPRKMPVDADKKDFFKENLSQLTGTKAAYYFTSDREPIGKVPVKEIYNTMRESGANMLMLDGMIDQRLVETAARSGIKFLVGMSADRIRVPRNIKVVTLNDLE